jgi:peptidoglycan/xylan/chitin deacetylase (PgdA/CDA1 family)
MVGNGLDLVRIGSSTASRLALVSAVCLLFAGSAAQAGSDADCPGHPDALGTSRTLVVDPRAHPRIGSMQYPETLPLQDHEVVLTFDDGPLPRNSNQVLQILADQCIKATFFEIGEQAKENPDGIRKLIAAGHTVASHSYKHPLNFNKMSPAQAQQEAQAGIDAIKAAMTDPSQMSPFFRIPGLMRGEGVEEFAASAGLQIWSTDELADDWHRISSEKVYTLAIQRLEEAHKGILLLHDIQARTVGALPKILHELKARGFRIVHVVPATAELPATASEPEQWLTHRPSLEVAYSRWPKLPNFIYDETEALPVPALSEFEAPDSSVPTSAEPLKRGAATWPRVAVAQTVEPASTTLPVPAENLFARPEKARAALQPFPTQPHHFDIPVVTAEGAEGEAKAAPPATSTRVARATRGSRGRVRVTHAVRQSRHVAAAAKSEKSTPPKQARAEKGTPKRTVRVASLKKHLR